MPVRKKKKSGRYRATRTCGCGNAKNRRGKGNKGGWGRAGMKKHRFTYITRYEPGFFGKKAKGFVRQNKSKVRVINIRDIESELNSPQYKEQKHRTLVFCGKVLGAGQITRAVEVRAVSFTKTAIKKIETAGGKTVKLSPDEFTAAPAGHKLKEGKQ